MVAERITDKRHISQLRAAYNVAFAQLAREADVWEELRGQNPHPNAVAEARHRVRKAEAAYRECRNAISAALKPRIHLGVKQDLVQMSLYDERVG